MLLGLAALPALALGIPLAPPLQEDGDEGAGPDPRVVALSETDRLLADYLTAQGGVRFDELETIAFQLERSILQADGSTLELDPIYLEAQLRGGGRTVRSESVVGERRFVTISDGRSARVWIDGDERALPEPKREAAIEANQLYQFLDLLLRPDSPELARRFDGVRERDEVAYRTMHLAFHPSREIVAQFRNYYHPETLLLERIDQYKGELLQREKSYLLDGYVEHGEIHFPREMRIVDRSGRELMRWRMSDVILDGEIDPARFRELAPGTERAKPR